MANGTMVGCYEYYTSIGETEVASRYSGIAGTTTNPYAVEDVFDLQNVIGEANNEASFVLVNDVDYNDHPTRKYGMSRGYLWNDKSVSWGYSFSGKDPITGKNHEIRNIVVLSSSVSTNAYQSSYISNINFVNMILKDVSYNSNSFWRAEISNCNFSLMFINSSPGRLFRSDKYTDCSFNIYGSNNSSSSTEGYTFNLGTGESSAKTRCHFNFNGFIYTCLESPIYLFWAQGNGYNAAVHDCYFTGSIKLKGHKSNTSVRMITNINLYNSYFAISLSSISGGTLGYCLFESPVSTSFIDKDVLGLTISDSSSNLYKLTTAQAQSYDYLNGIGFPVIPASEE